MDQQTAVANSITTALTADGVDDIERKMHELAEGVGAMRIEPGIAGAIVQDLLMRPENLTAVVTSTEQLRNVIDARFGKDEAEYLMHNDADFLRTLSAEVDEDGRLYAFARYVDDRAALSYRVPTTRLIGTLSGTGAALKVFSVLGISESGWAALFAITDSGKLRLYYMHECTSLAENPDNTEQSYVWKRHPRLPDFCVDELGAYSIYRDLVAVWMSSTQHLFIASLDPSREIAVYRDVECWPETRMVVTAVVATARYAVLLLDNTAVVFVWLTMPEAAVGASQIAGCLMNNEFLIEPHEQLASRPVPTNPFTGELLEPLAGLGGGGQDIDKWMQKHHANALAIDQHDENVVVIGTDCGSAPLVEIGAEPQQLRMIDMPLQMGEPPELDLLRGAAVRKTHPGLEPIEMLCARSPHKDGSICTTMAHSLSFRCPRALFVSQLAGATTRIPCAQEVNVQDIACIQLNGLDLLVHQRNSNAVVICNITPSKSGRIMRYRVAPPTTTDPKTGEEVEIHFPVAKSAYRSLYVSLEHATVLMPDGRCLRVKPSGEQENAAYIKLMMKPSADAAAPEVQSAPAGPVTHKPMEAPMNHRVSLTK